MTLEQGVEFVREALMMIIITSLPALGAALVVGLVISVFQAVTQIQEQTLTFVPKIIAIGAVFVMVMPWLTKKLMEYSTNLFAGW